VKRQKELRNDMKKEEEKLLNLIMIQFVINIRIPLRSLERSKEMKDCPF